MASKAQKDPLAALVPLDFQGVGASLEDLAMQGVVCLQAAMKKAQEVKSNCIWEEAVGAAELCVWTAAVLHPLSSCSPLGFPESHSGRVLLGVS